MILSLGGVQWKYLPDTSLRLQLPINRIVNIKELQLIQQYLRTTKLLYDNYLQLDTHAWRKSNTLFKVNVSYENDGLWNQWLCMPNTSKPLNTITNSYETPWKFWVTFRWPSFTNKKHHHHAFTKNKTSVISNYKSKWNTSYILLLFHFQNIC